MQIKRFEAQNMTEALRMIKKEFGSEAVILSATSLKKEKGIFGSLRKPGVEVTAAMDTHESESISIPMDVHKDQTGFENSGRKNSSLQSIYEGRKVINNKPDPKIRENDLLQNDAKEFFTLHHQMVSEGVQEEIASEIIEELKSTGFLKKNQEPKKINKNLIRVLEEIDVEVSPIKIEDGKQKTVAFVGPAGVGKTTTIAKLAAVQTFRMKKRVALITLDNYRIAGIEQLKVYAKIIGIPMEVASNSKEFKESLKKLRNKDLILIDTAGMSPRDEDEFNELKGVFDKIHPDEIHLLMSAATKDNDLINILKRFKLFSINRLIFTKLDETTSHGNILNQLIRTKIPVSYFTNGRQVPECIEEATLEKLVDLTINREMDGHLLSTPLEIIKDEKKEEKINAPHFRKFHIANKNSGVFHSPECKYAKRIKAGNKIVFESVLEAVNKKFKPCKLCSSDRVEKYNPLPEVVDEKKIDNYR
ncbi:MAG: flagellar biosynthesis protein FlhF [Deltaproteobacteria bacterium]|nr:flagellar biosynthesis protein FlhF [Deltaproteobacteria bacterium]